MKNNFFTLLCALSFTTTAFGLTLSLEVTSPAGCPDNMSVTTRAVDGDPGSLLVIAELTPEEPDLYKGRVRATGRLTVNAGDKLLVESWLVSSVKNGKYTFRFKLAKHAFKDSTLMLETNLYEKDGLATVGGGEIFEVVLSGFLP